MSGAAITWLKELTYSALQADNGNLYLTADQSGG